MSIKVVMYAASDILEHPAHLNILIASVSIRFCVSSRATAVSQRAQRKSSPSDDMLPLMPLPKSKYLARTYWV